MLNLCNAFFVSLVFSRKKTTAKELNIRLCGLMVSAFASLGCGLGVVWAIVAQAFGVHGRHPTDRKVAKMVSSQQGFQDKRPAQNEN